MGAAYRPLQGQKKEKLSILSLCLVLSLRRLLLSSLALSLSPSVPSTTISETKPAPLMCRVKKKEMLRVKKKRGGGLRKQNVVGHRFDNIQGIFPSFESLDTVQRAPAH